MLVRRAMTFFVLAGALAAPTTAAAQVWLPPERIVVQQDIGAVATGMNGTGDAVIVWDVGTFGEGLRSASRVAGGAWRSDGLVPGTVGRFTMQGQVGVDAARRLYVVWKDFAADEIRFATRVPPGGWSASQPVATGTAVRVIGLGVTGDGRVLVAWLDNGRLMTRRRRANGTWETATPVSSGSASLAVVTMNARGDALAVWAETDSTGLAMQLWYADALAGGGWTQPEELGDAGAISAGDVGVGLADSGEAVAAWRRDATLELATRPVSRVWQQPTTLASPAIHPLAPAVGMSPRGSAALVWGDDAGMHGVMRAPGGAWTLPAPLSSRISPRPVIRVSPSGAVFAVWGAPGATSQIVEGRVGEAGRTWGALQTLSTSTFNSTVRGVSFDDTGNGLAVWSRVTGPHDGDLQASGLDGSAPRLSQPLVPPVAVAGSPVSASVSALDVWAGLAGAPTWTFGDGGTAAGTSTTHVYRRPGAYTVTVRAVDRLGRAAARSTPVRVVAPTVGLGRTKLAAAFRRSHLSGRARVRLRGRLSGTVGARLDLHLTGRLRPTGRVVSLPALAVDVPPGGFDKTLVIPARTARRMLPGQYTLTVNGTAGGADLARAVRRLRVKSPPEGVVLETRVSTTPNGRGLASVTRTRSLWVFFTFARGARPRANQKLRADWYPPGHRSPIDTFEVKRGFTFWRDSQDLAEGRWRVVLRTTGRKVIAVASIRIG